MRGLPQWAARNFTIETTNQGKGVCRASFKPYKSRGL